MRQKPVHRHVRVGGRPCDNADTLIPEFWIVDGGDILKSAAALGHQRISRPVVRDRRLRLVVAKGESDDHVATIGAQRHPDKARRLREIGDVMGVRVLDHLIIGKGKYVSFVDDGYWER